MTLKNFNDANLLWGLKKTLETCSLGGYHPKELQNYSLDQPKKRR